MQELGSQPVMLGLGLGLGGCGFVNIVALNSRGAAAHLMYTGDPVCKASFFHSYISSDLP